MPHVQFDLFTTKLTLRLRSGRAPDTKGSDILNSALRITIVKNSRALRKFTYHHEGHEEHEVRNAISTNVLTFVAFVSFVVKISVFFGCGSPALGSLW